MSELDWTGYNEEVRERLDRLEKAWKPELSSKEDNIDPIEKANLMVNIMNNNLEKGIIDNDTYEKGVSQLEVLLEKARSHNYWKREGTPGNYKYWYSKEEYESKTGKKDDSDGDKGGETTGIKKEEDDNKSKLKINDRVKIPINLTSDPHNRQGQEGKIIKVDEKNDEVTVEFENGGSGRYQLDAVNKIKDSDKDDSGENKGISSYRKHLIDSDDKELSEYAKKASTDAIKRRMNSDTEWKNK
jgi:hypothetical protein